MPVILYSFKLSQLFGKSVKNTFICKNYSALNKCLVILSQEKNQYYKIMRLISFNKLLIVFLMVFTVSANAAEIWVSPSGKDSNLGTKSNPLATVHMAMRKARELRRLKDASIKDGIRIIVMNGTYYLNEPLFVRPEDSGTAESPTTIEADVNASPIISGGIEIKNWTKSTTVINGLKKGSVWVADAPKKAGSLIDYRQLWVNGKKAVRAKNTAGTTMERILSWNHVEQTCWIPAPKEAHLEQAKGLEFFIHQWWEIAQLRVKKIEVQGDSAKLTFFQPESRIQSEHPWPAPWISKETGNSAFYLCNALQFLDEAGEYYCDPIAQKIYYFPFANENMLQSEVIASHLETLVRIEGTPEKPVQHFHIQNISFEHTAYWRPATHGHVAHQTGMPMTDAYKLKIAGTPEKQTLENQAWIIRPTAAVSINHSQNIHIKDCLFTHTASTGLDLYKGVNQSSVTGNVFKDIPNDTLESKPYRHLTNLFNFHSLTPNVDESDRPGLQLKSNNLLGTFDFYTDCSGQSPTL